MKEMGQYAVAFSLVGVMLYAAGFPVFFLLFIGVLMYFIWKIFSSESRSDVRRIFEFYLTANEILREDYRQWYGFEINDAISSGEKIVRAIPNAPPLVHFALGALYDRVNDHNSVVKHLSYLSEESGNEAAIAFPSNDLREYVRILRKIERSPAEAPQTSASVRSLERMRKSRAVSLLEKHKSFLESQDLADDRSHELLPSPNGRPGVVEGSTVNADAEGNSSRAKPGATSDRGRKLASSQGKQSPEREMKSAERKTISEVLHDIYDGSSDSSFDAKELLDRR